MDYNYKQAILIRQDLQLGKGKACSQAAHAAVEAVLRSEKEIIKQWREQGMPKIVLKVQTEKDLKKYNQAAKDMGLITALITDAGRTQIAPGSTTALAIGPDKEEKIDTIIKELKLL